VIERRPWSNWAGNQRCAPIAVEHPRHAHELAAVVKAACAAGRTVKAIGTGHSFTDIGCTDGHMLVLDRFDRVLHVDQHTLAVTAEAGITIRALNRALARHGLAMPNLGDIAYQTISGAIATATHGTGRTLGGIATQVIGLELVTGDGSVVRCSAHEEPDVFHAARVGLGALGIVSTVTLQCVPAFRLHALEQAMRLDDVLEQLDQLIDDNDHFEFFWFPHTSMCSTKRNNRTEDAISTRGRWKEWRDHVWYENVLFGAQCRVGRARPSLIPRLNARTASQLGKVWRIEQSHKVFASPRYVHFYEMEYSIPRAHCADAVRQLRTFIDTSGLNIGFPVEVRFVAGDDIPLSTAHGGERCYIAVHVYRGMQHEQYFRGVEAIMREFDGRPHWGKLHFRTAADLAPAYPEWDRFQAVRRRLDPDGRFRNAYLDRVLGPID
jgi:L-gulonolactone oxidase